MTKKPSTSKKKVSDEAGLAAFVELGEEATGSRHFDVQITTIKQLIEVLWLPSSLDEDQRDSLINSAILKLAGIKPTDEIEGMLGTQMVATHEAAMECFRRAMLPNQTFEGREQNLKHAEKLLSVYAQLLGSLDKHRGKGQQKVTVEHVHVEAGGQAVVGNVEAGGTSAQAGKGDASKPKAITQNSPEIIDMDLGTKKLQQRRKRSK